MRSLPGGSLSGAPRQSQWPNLCIAGVTFEIRPDPALRLRLSNPLYRSFAGSAATASAAWRIRVRMDLRSVPSLQRRDKIFDTHESWAMFRDKKYHWVRYQPAGRPTPFWTARFAGGARQVVIFRQSADGPGAEPPEIFDHPICYPLDQLLLMYFLARRHGILMHAAGMVRKGKTYLFAGASGAGKSTISLLLAAAKVGKLLSDERMIVREIDGTLRAFGTPWAGTAGIARSGAAPLAGIYFLKHGQSNRVEKMSATAALDRLLPVVSVPWYDPDAAAPIIAFTKQVAAAVPCHEFSFKPDPSAVDLFQQFIASGS